MQKKVENLPVADNTADVVISNCVINLSPSKLRVSQGSSARASSAVQTFDVHALQVILAVIVLR
jgi:hypothetical protein